MYERRLSDKCRINIALSFSLINTTVLSILTQFCVTQHPNLLTKRNDSHVKCNRSNFYFAITVVSNMLNIDTVNKFYHYGDIENYF